MLDPSVEADLRDLFGQVSQGLDQHGHRREPCKPRRAQRDFERSVGITGGAANSCGGGGQFLQVGGVRVTFACAATAQQVSAPPPGATFGAVVVPGAPVSELALDAGTPGDPSDDIPIEASGAVVPGAPTVRLVTNSFTPAGGDNNPTLATQTDRINLPATYEQTLVEYLATVPATGSPALPTIPATDARYAAVAGPGRITLVP